ncbi:hypothetical protein B296_00053422 [Ensete ventricosum]|uniref:Uncharacterized protein n=1 Tax=Ensete ventricosum TaxID=4639 RepID=A0A426X2D3_ENSVE|nr:hypothetical protein B296_00053422 [Ensete ventricosum]
MNQDPGLTNWAGRSTPFRGLPLTRSRFASWEWRENSIQIGARNGAPPEETAHGAGGYLRIGADSSNAPEVPVGLQISILIFSFLLSFGEFGWSYRVSFGHNFDGTKSGGFRFGFSGKSTRSLFLLLEICVLLGRMEF